VLLRQLLRVSPREANGRAKAAERRACFIVCVSGVA
jgi:hypothetical protein